MASDLETLAFGYGLIEGPRVDRDGSLYFSDVTGGGVYQRSTDGEITTVVPKRRGVGGIVVHADGGIVISGRNICHVKDGETRMIFDDPDVPGFNDIGTDNDGRILAGSVRSDPFGTERIPGELWRIAPDGSATTLYDDVSLCNGLGFSPDGATLYHSDSGRRQILAHDVSSGGAVSNRRVFATTAVGAPDGLAVDEAGNVWVASYGGGCAIAYDDGGNETERVAVPATAVTSLTFAGRDLYIVTADNAEDPSRNGTIFRTTVDVPGLAVPHARV
jgi:xylono-1,5-lactonase